MNIFKIVYTWYEGDYGETLLAKEVTEEEFEKDLVEAKKFAEKLIGIKIKDGDYLGKGYRVECLPEFYEQIIWFLMEKKSYMDCTLNDETEYFVDDGPRKEISVQKRIQKTTWEEVGGKKCPTNSPPQH